MRQPVPFGKYLLLDRISVGGMAEVFKAKSYGVEGFERIIAIKRILPSMGEDKEFIRMFIDEAKIAGQLSHPNIGQIFELGRAQDAHYIAMEYIWGKDLLQIQNRCRKRGEVMPLGMASFIVAKAAEGLDYAHRKRDAMGTPLEIVHRDCSPQNVLISYEGEVKVIDFGIARAASRSSRTNAGVLKGKFGYMSPEQVRGLPLDHRSDIFALGTILYECLTGDRLFQGESDFSTLEKVRNADVRPPSQLRDDIPPELERLVMRALARDPRQRYQWCSELHADLNQYLTRQRGVFTAKNLGEWLRQWFADDLEREQQQLEVFRLIGRDGLFAGESHAAARLDVSAELGAAGVPDGDPTTLSPPRFGTSVSADEGGRATPARRAEPEVRVLVSSRSASGSPLEVRAAAYPVVRRADIVDASTERIDASTERIDASTDAIDASTEPIDAPTVPIDASTDAIPAPSWPTGPGAYGPRVTSRAFALGAAADEDGALGPRSAGDSTPGAEVRTPVTGIRRRRAGVGREVGIAIGFAALVLAVVVSARFLFFSDGGQHQASGVVAATGTIAVVVGDDLQADVLLDGRKVGVARGREPLSLASLAPRTYALTVSRPGSPPCQREVKVEASRVEVVTCSLAPPVAGRLLLGGLDVGHVVSVDDQELSAEATHEPIHLTPGRRHVVVIQRAGVEVERFEIEVAAGEVIERTIDPGGSRARGVGLGARGTATRPRAPAAERSLADGDDGERPPAGSPDLDGPDRDLDDRPTATAVESARLGGGKPPPPAAAIGPGRFTAFTQPFARVLIDGRDTGKMTPIAPRSAIVLPPGPHKVTFVVGDRRYSFDVQIEAGKTKNLVKSLGAAPL